MEGTAAENVLKHGTGALNIDGCRIAGEKNPSIDRRKLAAKSGKAGMDLHSANRVKRGLPAFNKDLTQYVEGHDGEQLARWPSHLIHDGSDEVLANLPSTSHHGHGPKQRGKGGIACNGHNGQDGLNEVNYLDSGSAARFFYCAKASKEDRDEGCKGLEAVFSPTMNDGIGVKEHNPETATPKRNHHPTVKSTSLMRYLCRLITPPGGLILDPVMGSGSTGKACVLEGFRFLGIEREADYFAIARRRVATPPDAVRWLLEQVGVSP